EYENDDGFVEDAPRSKKAKNAGANEGKKATISTEAQTDDEGNEYWELSRTRRVGVSTFKKATMISIREYYEKDGKSLPGKKGISLSVDQYTALLSVLPQLESILRSQGIDVPRPQYDGPGAIQSLQEGEDDGQDEEADADEGKDEKPVKTSKLDKFKLKANHEATSDEDEG
ncbi:hypothetical protein B0A55_12878, partial [Friedmanniomyces simplex]